MSPGWSPTFQVSTPPTTPEEYAASMVADPKWRFATDPANAVGSVSASAANAAVNGRIDSAKYWTRVGLALVRLADNPHVRVGTSLGELAERFRLGWGIA